GVGQPSGERGRLPLSDQRRGDRGGEGGADGRAAGFFLRPEAAGRREADRGHRAATDSAGGGDRQEHRVTWRKINEWIGCLGFDCERLTLWEIQDAYLGAMRDRWDRHSRHMALLANCNRNPEKQRRPYTPDQFNAFP